MHENMLWPDGTGYEGEVRVCKVNENDRKYHGQGTYIYSNGDKYEGEWKDGAPWVGNVYDQNRTVVKTWVNGVWQES